MSSGRYPGEWYAEDDSWDTVAEWLVATKNLSGNHYRKNLYGARQRWKEDRKTVEETA
jgi:hypothetical protein